MAGLPLTPGERAKVDAQLATAPCQARGVVVVTELPDATDPNGGHIRFRCNAGTRFHTDYEVTYVNPITGLPRTGDEIALFVLQLVSRPKEAP